MLNPAFIVKVNAKLGGAVLNENSLLSIFSSVEYYETIEEKIACIVRGLIKNHAFTDANKRTANLAFYALCDKNGIPVTKTSEQMFEITIDIATHHYSVEKVKSILFS